MKSTTVCLEIETKFRRNFNNNRRKFISLADCVFSLETVLYSEGVQVHFFLEKMMQHMFTGIQIKCPGINLFSQCAILSEKFWKLQM